MQTPQPVRNPPERFLVEEERLPQRRHRIAALILASALLTLAAGAPAADGVVVARERAFTARLTAYARVAPIALLHLRAELPGRLDGLARLPGDQVRAGAVIARLEGPEVRALLAERRAAVASAGAALEAARQALAIDRQNERAHLSTRLAVAQARAARAKAEAQAAVAGARLRAAIAMTTLRSPVDGLVLSLHAANGQRIDADETILSVQPIHSLWLQAVFYGAAASAVHVGMRGSFSPFEGGSPVPVRVRSVVGVLRSDGGREVRLVPDPEPSTWQSGEAGTLTLTGRRRTLVAVPTRALILDRGRWWVLVHTDHGNRKRSVIPGPSRGNDTLIEQGLAAGSPIVVENAYLEFHRRLSRRYQPPD